jgi:hypothetical protein
MEPTFEQQQLGHPPLPSVQGHGSRMPGMMSALGKACLPDLVEDLISRKVVA